jgi:hypothetical protein
MTVASNEVQEVVHAVRAIHDINVPNTQRLQFTQAIETLKDSNPCNTVPLAFQLAGHEDPYVRHVGWNIIEHVIRYKWLELNMDLRLTVRNGVLDHISHGRFSLTGTDSHIKTAVSRSVVGMMEHEWPQNWPELFPQFQAIVADPKLTTQCHMVFLVLKRLIENVITLTSVESPGRKKDLHSAINLYMPQILEMTVARIQLCITTNSEDSVLLAKSAIELLSEIVEWIGGRVLEEIVDNIINVLCAYLRTETCGIFEEAAKCLGKLASRKRAKTDETPIVVSLFKETPMQSIIGAANAAAEVSSSTVEQYNYLKALCDLLCALGVHLSEVWSYVKNPPPNFSLYLSAITAFFVHPSVYIRGETAQVLVTFSTHTEIGKTREFISCIQQILTFIPRSMEKVGAPSETDGLTSHYSRMDYEDDMEFFHDYIQLRDRCCRLVRENTQQHFAVLFNIMTEWMANRCLAKPQEVRATEWDSMKRYLNTFLPATYQLELVDEKTDQTYLTLFDGILNSLSLSSDPRIVNEELSVLSSFFPLLNTHSDRIPPILALMKALLSLENPGNLDQDITSMKRHCSSLLLKLVSSFSTVLKSYASSVLEVVVSVADRVSVMQRANLVQVLAGLSNLATSSEEQHLFLQSAIQTNIQYLLNEPFISGITSTPNFLTYIGLRANAPASEAEAQATPFYENRLSLKSHLCTIDGVIQQVNVPEDKSNPLFPLLAPVIPSIFQLVRCLNAIYLPENKALIHSSYGPSVVEILPNDRQQIFCAIMETVEQPSPINPLTADSAFHLRRFIGEITEYVQSIVGYIGTKLRFDFYSMPNVTEMMLSTTYSIETIPDFRVRFWIKRTWSRLFLSCPVEKSSTIIPLMTTFSRHMYSLVTTRWNDVEKVDYDGEPSEEELFTESMTSILSREIVGFLKLFITSDSTANGKDESNKKRSADVIGPLGERLLKEKDILDNTTALLFSLINCPDTQTAIKAVPIATALVINLHTLFYEEIARFMLVQGIRSLQVHGSDEVALGPLLGLVFQIYSLFRPNYPSFLEILRQVPDATEENLVAFDNRVIAMLQNNEKLIDKNKRDLIRKVLRPVIAQKVGERHRRPAQLRPLKPMEKRSKPDVENVFPVHTLFT